MVFDRAELLERSQLNAIVFGFSVRSVIHKIGLLMIVVLVSCLVTDGRCCLSDVSLLEFSISDFRSDADAPQMTLSLAESPMPVGI